MVAGISRLTFSPSVDASLALTLRWIAGGQLPVGIREIPAAMSEAISDLHTRLIASSVDVADFWDSWSDAIVAGDESNVAISEAMSHAGGTFLQSDSTTGGIARRVRELWVSTQSMYPKLGQQLPLRTGPIRSQWDTYGPGILKNIERQIWKSDPPSDWWPTQINVRMVHPIRGGGGDICGDGRSFWIEAMLTDSDPAIPEVLRMAWLACRVAIDTHLRSRSGVVELRRGWSWASVPLVLTAAAEIGVTPQPISIGSAMQHWKFSDPAIARRVETWWNDRDESVPMPVRLRGLAATG